MGLRLRMGVGFEKSSGSHVYLRVTGSHFPVEDEP